MVNMTDSEFAIIKAILKVVSDKCNLYWQDESQAEDDYEKKEYENYLELKKDLKYHIDLDKYKDIDLSKLLYELK
jgi:hypothetical protein|tara:strand:- start:187 stop:411 length:225 start_codon:yes stop_codon:yes gene_type:complete